MNLVKHRAASYNKITCYFRETMQERRQTVGYKRLSDTPKKIQIGEEDQKRRSVRFLYNV